uniref:hypothetical protein n=1 Tax=Dictyotopsis propagulifera TaxID=670095 RepID=UPI002E771941|nr:hypothetical protein V2485_pgp012 [Dictyotopsis propagulifera]WAM63245.1 hypothetical protein [Dictyotopsis propagulifera]
MNHGIFIIKVIENPQDLNFQTTSFLKILVCFAKAQHKAVKTEINLILWGNFKEDFINYYKIKDYLLVEGIITSKTYTDQKEEVNLIAKRLYPFLLD